MDPALIFVLVICAGGLIFLACQIPSMIKTQREIERATSEMIRLDAEYRRALYRYLTRPTDDERKGE